MGCASSSLCWSTNVSGPGIPANGVGVLHVVQDQGLGSSVSTTQDPPFSDDIAIVGIGCRTPGADNIREFWRVLQSGECHVGDVPANRWNARAFLDTDPHAAGKAYVQKGGFMQDIEGFDNALYGINEYEACQMDPQQCLLLECTSMAMEDAGLTRTHLSGSDTGVYIGAMNSDYSSFYMGKTSKMGNQAVTGISSTIMASRLSFVFNLTGPCMVLDTACSASLVAMHQGCQAIRSGDCSMAICGGVNCMQGPDMFVQLSKARMISPTGLCHAFSDQADGYTRGEGCGVVILKRLTDAIRDGDNVRAIIYTGTNQDGHAVTPMIAPSGEQQKKLLHSVYDKFQVDVSQVDYIEAHGTGTPAGDPVEVNALGSFFHEKGTPRDRHIGSVKTNIGHTESAAGVLGLIKALLMMEHNTIVPSLHCDVVNPKLDITGNRFVIPRNPLPWTKPHKVVACNSFGFGGSNSHAVIRTFVREKSDQPRKKHRCIVCFSGKSQKALKNSLKDFYDDEDVAVLDVNDVSYTSTARRDHHPFRVAFTVEDMDDLVDAVKEKLSHDKWAPPVPSQLNVVLVFCGMGTAWGGMCRELLEEYPVFRDAVLEVEKHLSAYVPWSLTDRLGQEDPSKDVLLAPIAIFACQVGLAAVWRSLGVQPACVVGQSIGEITAAYTAGCLSLSDAVKIIYHRSQLLAEVTDGAMVVVQNVEVDQVRAVVGGMKGKASIALEYSPKACAISADPDTMRSLRPQLVSQLRSTHKDMRLVDLDVQVAYHSSYVGNAADKLRKLIKDVAPRKTEIPLISTVTGKVVRDAVQSGHWVDNVQKPVLFHQAMMESVAHKTSTNTVFLEVGPRPVLRAHMQDLFPDQQHRTVPSITVQSEMKCLHQSIATLYELGADMNLGNLPTHGSQVTAVPRYSFDKKYLKEQTEQMLVQNTGCDIFKKNHLYVYPAEESPESFCLLLSPLTLASVYQHVVMGKIVVPGAVYAECGFAVARNIYAHTNVSMSVEFERVLSLDKEELAVIDIRPTESPSGTTERHFGVWRKERKLADVRMREVNINPRDPVNLKTVCSCCTDKVNKATIYDSLKRYGFEYGPAFSQLREAYRSSSECLATLEVHETVLSEMPGTTIHPCILDCMLQSTVLVVGSGETEIVQVLPKSLSGLTVIRPMEREMYIYSRLSPTGFGYEIRLLTTDGHVIAELRDFAVQVLTSKREDVRDMLSVHWDKVKEFSLDTLKDKGVQEHKGKLLLISERKLTGEDSHVICLTYNSNDTTHSHRRDLDSLLKTQTVETVVFLVPTDDFATKEADDTQSKLISLSLLIQTILTSLNEHFLRVPVFMLTFNAWPCPDGGQVRDVNPVATALWGLLRTVMAEHVYPYVVAVDLQFAEADLNSQSLQRLVETLTTLKEVADYPEFLITENTVYANQVARLKGSSVSPPWKRQNLPTRMGEVNGGAVVLSQEAFNLQQLSTVSREIHLPSKDHMILKSHSFALPPEKLINTKISSDHLFPNTKEQKGYVVMALEVTGHTKEDPGQQLTSCGPVTVSPELAVAVDTTLTTASLPDYQPGDLCKLVLFWSLVDKVPSERFSVLASSDTRHLAELLKLLSVNATKRKDTDVSIILMENIKDNPDYHETVLSLILLDVNTVSVMVRGCKNPHSLITLTSLITKDLSVYMACALPETQLCLVDTQLLFQLSSLKTVIPHIKEWIRKNAGLMSSVSQHLHCMCKVDDGGDINDLVQFHSLNLPSLSVQHVNDKLFRKDGAYIVVGGLTGLGWLCVEFLAQNNAGFIAIVNRRAPSQEQLANMKNLAHQFDCQIKSFQGDVSSMTSLQQVLTLLKDEWSQKGHLRGVFCGAAVIQDGFFPAMERSAFESVLSPKVKGAWNLHQLTKDLPLDYFVLHSSVASVLGNLGQANYCAANAFLDGLVFHRRYLGLSAQTVNWGPLDTGLLDNQDALKQSLISTGFNITSKQEIKEILSDLMLLNWPQSIPVSPNSELYTKRIRGTMQSLLKRFQHLLSETHKEESQGLEQSLEQAHKYRFLQPPERLEAYEGFVQVLATRILSVDIARVTQDVNLYDLGLDSVTGMMMVSLIERYTTFKLSVVSALSEVTVTSMAQILDTMARETKE